MWAVSGSAEEEEEAPLTGPGAEGKGSLGTLPVPRFSTTLKSTFPETTSLLHTHDLIF